MQLLGAVRTIKQDIGTYAFQCIFAVGPFSILFLESRSGSPFNVREAVPVRFFSAEQVAELLRQFSVQRNLVLEDGIVEDIHEFTAGHAGLVCACGRALDSIPQLRIDGRILLAAWREFRVVRMVTEALGWPTVGRMARAVADMPHQALDLLEHALVSWDAPLILEDRPEEAKSAARYLAAEGWLLASSPDTYGITSPLVRSLALQQLASKRARQITAPLPFMSSTSQLDIPAVVATALQYFSADSMCITPRVSTKLSKASAAVVGRLAGEPVPSEASYHFQLFSVLRQWVGLWQHASLYPEADVKSNGRPKRYADMLLIGRNTSAPPKHILELVANADDVAVREHFQRTLEYMAVHETSRGSCVVFTTVESAAAIAAATAHRLTWPTAAQLEHGLVAVHVIHDIEWTEANVVSLVAEQASPSSKRVQLKPGVAASPY